MQHVVSGLALCLAVPHLALANDFGVAESLYREAQVLMKEGKAADACPKFEESQRLDPTGSTAFELAKCLEQTGKVASAWARYEEALDFAKRKGAKAREKEIQTRIDAVVKTLPRLVIVVSKELSALPGFSVQRGGREVGSGQWNASIPLDPGPVTVSATATGRLEASVSVVLRLGEETRATLPSLELPKPSPPASASVLPPASTPPPSASSTSLDRAPTPTSSNGAPRGSSNTLGLALLGGGLVSLGVGVGFGLTYRSLYNEAREACPNSTCGEDTRKRAQDKSDAATTAGTISMVGLGAGVVLSGVGAFLLFRSPHQSAVVPAFSVGKHHTSMGLLGRF